MEWKIPLFKSYWEDEDINAIAKVIRRGIFWATGEEIDRFEDNISKFIGTKFCVSFNSGTSALYSCLLAHGITSGEVIVPSFTFIATANTVVLAGAIPVFAESESDTFGLDANDVEKKINKKTKAIILIHYGGLACRDTQKLKEIAEKNKIFLIEDAAESLGSTFNNIKVGHFGDSAMFSFCQNKVITMGEGGVIVTDDKYLSEKLKLIRSHGRVEKKPSDYFSSTKEPDYIELGHNFRLSTISAALGLSQLNRIEKVTLMRRKNAQYLTNNLKDIDSIITPKEQKYQHHVYQMYTIIVDPSEERDALQQHLSNAGILTRIYFHPIHIKHYYKRKYGYQNGALPFTEKLSNSVLTLPMYPTLTKGELDYMIETIYSFYKG